MRYKKVCCSIARYIRNIFDAWLVSIAGLGGAHEIGFSLYYRDPYQELELVGSVALRNPPRLHARTKRKPGPISAGLDRCVQSLRVVRVKNIGMSSKLGGSIHSEQLDPGSDEPVTVLLREGTSREDLQCP